MNLLSLWVERSRLFATCAAVVCVGAFAVLGWLFTYGSGVIDRGPIRVLLVVNLVLLACGILVSIMRGFRPVSFVFFLFSFCWLGVAPVVQVLQGQSAWDDWQVVRDMDLVTRGLLLNLLFWSAVLLPALLVRDRGRRGRYMGRPRVSMIWTLVVFLAFLSAFAIRSQNGIGTLFSSRADRLQELNAAGLSGGNEGAGVGQGILLLLPVAVSVVLVLISVSTLRWGRERGRPAKSAWLGLAAGTVGLILFANPLTATRFISAIGFGSALIMLWRPIRPRSGVVALIVGLFVILVGYPGLDQSTAPGEGTGLGDSIERSLTGPDFDGFQQLLNTISYVDAFGHSHGSHLLAALFFFVPRSIWEGKAEPATFEVAHHAGYWFANLSLPFHAELYLDLGVAGTVVVGFLLGVVMRVVDGAWLANPGNGLGIVAPLVALSMLALMRGPLTSLVGVYLPAIGFLFVWVAWSGAPEVTMPPEEAMDQAST